MYMTVKTVLSFGRSVHHDSSFVFAQEVDMCLLWF